ncbi:ferritin [Candidatus Parcubacteria bacterium]|nr:MAG: ferritin [Candidatus Parcubacteria bacterium]
MKIFVCRICGEVYIGDNIPPTCPFCGVAQKYLGLAHVWKDTNNVELSEVSRKNFEDALKLELSNASFYKCASKTLSNTEVALMFKGLYKVEREHAEVFEKILKPENLPEINEACEDDVAACLKASQDREERAVEFYAKALSEATEDRVREVFEAIMNVEKDHIVLDEEMNKKYN